MDKQLNIDIIARDGFSGVFAKLTNSVNKIAGKSSTMFVGATAGLDKISNQLGAIGTKMTTVGTGMSFGITAPIAKLGYEALMANSKLGLLERGIERLFDGDKAGSGKAAAKDLSSFIQDFGAKTPFEIGDIQKAAAMFASVDKFRSNGTGYIKQQVTMLSDIVAAYGGSSDDLLNLAKNHTEILQMGKAQTKDLRQMASRMIPILGELKRMPEIRGMLEAQMKEMETGAKKGLKARMQKLLGTEDKEGIALGALIEGGLVTQGVYLKALDNLHKRTKGSAAEAAESFSGMVSNMNDLKQIFLQGFGAALERIFKVTNGFGGLIEKAKAFKDQLLALPDDKLRTIFMRIAAIAAIGPTMAVLGATIFGVSQAVGALRAILVGVAALSNPFVALAAGAAVLIGRYVAVNYKTEEFRQMLQNAFERAKQAFADFMNIAGPILNDLQSAFSVIISTAQAFGNMIVNVFQALEKQFFGTQTSSNQWKDNMMAVFFTVYTTVRDVVVIVSSLVANLANSISANIAKVLHTVSKAAAAAKAMATFNPIGAAQAMRGAFDYSQIDAQAKQKKFQGITLEPTGEGLTGFAKNLSGNQGLKSAKEMFDEYRNNQKKAFTESAEGAKTANTAITQSVTTESSNWTSAVTNFSNTSKSSFQSFVDSATSGLGTLQDRMNSLSAPKLQMQLAGAAGNISGASSIKSANSYEKTAGMATIKVQAEPGTKAKVNNNSNLKIPPITYNGGQLNQLGE